MQGVASLLLGWTAPCCPRRPCCLSSLTMPNIRPLPVADLVDVPSGYHNQSELGGPRQEIFLHAQCTGRPKRKRKRFNSCCYLTFRYKTAATLPTICNRGSTPLMPAGCGRRLEGRRWQASPGSCEARFWIGVVFLRLASAWGGIRVCDVQNSS